MSRNQGAEVDAGLTKKKLETLLDQWRANSNTATCRFFSSPARWCRKNETLETIGMPQSIIDIQKFVDDLSQRGVNALDTNDLKTLQLLDVMRKYRSSNSSQNSASNSSKIFAEIRESVAFQGVYPFAVQNTQDQSASINAIQSINQELENTVRQFKESARQSRQNIAQIRSSCQSAIKAKYEELKKQYSGSYQLTFAEQGDVVQIALNKGLIDAGKSLLYRSKEPKKLFDLLRDLGLQGNDQNVLLNSFASKQAEKHTPQLRREKNRAKVKHDLAISIERGLEEMPLVARKRQVFLLLNETADEDLKAKRWVLEKYAEAEFEARKDAGALKCSELSDSEQEVAKRIFVTLKPLDEVEKVRLWRLQRVEVASRVVQTLKSFFSSRENSAGDFVLNVSHVPQALIWVRSQPVATQEAFITAFEEAQDRGLEREFFERLRDAKKHYLLLDGFCQGVFGEKVTHQERVDQVIAWAADLWKDQKYPRKVSPTLVSISSEDSLVSPSHSSSGTPVSFDDSLAGSGSLKLSDSSDEQSPGFSRH